MIKFTVLNDVIMQITSVHFKASVVDARLVFFVHVKKL